METKKPILHKTYGGLWRVGGAKYWLGNPICVNRVSYVAGRGERITCKRCLKKWLKHAKSGIEPS